MGTQHHGARRGGPRRAPNPPRPGPKSQPKPRRAPLSHFPKNPRMRAEPFRCCRTRPRTNPAPPSPPAHAEEKAEDRTQGERIEGQRSTSAPTGGARAPRPRRPATAAHRARNRAGTRGNEPHNRVPTGTQPRERTSARALGDNVEREHPDRVDQRQQRTAPGTGLGPEGTIDTTGSLMEPSRASAPRPEPWAMSALKA